MEFPDSPTLINMLDGPNPEEGNFIHKLFHDGRQPQAEIPNQDQYAFLFNEDEEPHDYHQILLMEQTYRDLLFPPHQQQDQEGQQHQQQQGQQHPQQQNHQQGQHQHQQQQGQQQHQQQQGQLQPQQQDQQGQHQQPPPLRNLAQEPLTLDEIRPHRNKTQKEAARDLRVTTGAIRTTTREAGCSSKWQGKALERKVLVWATTSNDQADSFHVAKPGRLESLVTKLHRSFNNLVSGSYTIQWLDDAGNPSAIENDQQWSNCLTIHAQKNGIRLRVIIN